jgi:hypothetical protein
MIRCIRVLSLEDLSYLALLDHLLHHTFVPRIRYLAFTTRGKKGPLTTTRDLSACKSKRTLIQLLTVNTGVRQRSLEASKRRTRIRIARLASRLSKFAVAGHPSDGVMTKISEFTLEGHVSLIS